MKDDPRHSHVLEGGYSIVYYKDGTHVTIPLGVTVKFVTKKELGEVEIPTTPTEDAILRIDVEDLRAIYVGAATRKPALSQR